MSRPRRGDVFVASISGQEVPVVVVSRNSINDANPIIVIVPAVPKEQLEVTGYGHLVVVPQGTIEIQGEWVFVCTHVRSLRLDQLTAPAGTLPPRVMTKIDSALRTVLELN
jgi:mRNA-degrading endonuclease toxin of MazEF toxin-antitoxin module